MNRMAIGFLGLCIATHSAAAWAVTITNMTTGAMLFGDDFEGVSSVSSTVAVDLSGDYDPVAKLGTWSVLEDPTIGITQVTNSTTGPDPGPYQGSKYLRTYRSETETGNSLNGLMTADQTTPSDLIRMSMMVYVPNDGSVRTQILLVGAFDDYNTARAWVRSDGAGNLMYIGPGFNLLDTGIDYQPGVWQRWDLDYAINASTFSVSVNGVTASGLPSLTSGNVIDTYIVNSSAVAGSIYLDAVAAVDVVPEPSVALVALACVSISLIGHRRKQ